LKKIILPAALLVAVSGCGAMQSYNNSLDARQRAYVRQQALLDEQNIIQVNGYKAQQREQEVQAARAEGDKAKAKAAGDAQAAIEQARGEATANQLISKSLTPALIQYHMIDSLSDKNVYYLPSNLIISNLPGGVKAAAAEQQAPATPEEQK
jgi:regulator of protease activity HflC (stomatin/prohibitin superfamily)